MLKILNTSLTPFQFSWRCAREMVFEADLGGDGSLTFSGFLDAITVVSEAEIEQVLEHESAEVLMGKAKFLDLSLIHI